MCQVSQRIGGCDARRVVNLFPLVGKVSAAKRRTDGGKRKRCRTTRSPPHQSSLRDDSFPIKGKHGCSPRFTAARPVGPRRGLIGRLTLCAFRTSSSTGRSSPRCSRSSSRSLGVARDPRAAAVGISRGRAADDHGDRDLSGREPRDDRRNGRRAAGTGDQRRRKDDVRLLAIDCRRAPHDHRDVRTGHDLDDAQVLVQNRVATAEARLPEEVRRLGVTVDKTSPLVPDGVIMVSPDETLRPDVHLQLYHARCATGSQRIEGVGDGAGVRRARLFDAHLARSRKDRLARPFRERRARRPAPPERAGRRRRHRRRRSPTARLSS